LETLANLESFVRSAELHSFSAAARRLGLTPAAVSRNVAMLERNLDVRLFHRSTRKLTLTEAGEQFLLQVTQPLESLQSAIGSLSAERREPAGVLKVSVSLAFGMEYLLPMLPEFTRRFPRVQIDWQLDNRPVDLIAEGFDAAIGGGFELSAGVVARTLAPAHIIAVASPAYMRGRRKPATPEDLAELDGIVMRSARTGRVRQWTMRNAAGETCPCELRQHIVLNDPAAMVRAAVLGLGVSLVAVPDALPFLERKELLRVVPRWYADAGPISLYFASRSMLPAKTRAFVDHVIHEFKVKRLAVRFAGSLAG
jgi:DNA-binding transcriptional LysR family regulator